MTTRTVLSSAVLLALSTCMLAACGGGGSNGIGGFIRPESNPPSTPPPPPPPPPPLPEACLSPIIGDCFPDAGYSADMTGGRQSNYALIVRDGGMLNLKDGEFRFSGGTTISSDASILVVWNNLTSDVHVESPPYAYADGPELWLGGTLNGNLVNDYIVSLEHLCGTGKSCVEDNHPVINGNFQQSSGAYLDVVLGWPLQITGTAAVDGTLGFFRGTSQSYVLPTAPASVLVLHADGGVSGQFGQWFSEQALLLTGALRYLTNDVYFDATAIAAAPAMSAVGADPLTVQSAAHFDAALNNVAKAVTVSGAALSTTQHQFLSSVGTIQRLQDYSQATRTFDSLSGHGYADAADSLLQQAATPSAELMNRVGNLRAGLASGAWSTQSSMLASGGSTFSGQRGGFDQWFGERLLLGSSFGWSDGSLRFDRSGGSARDQSPQWDVYLRRNGSGNTYVFGDVGYSRHQLDFNRQIDLGLRRQTAGTRQSFDGMRAWVETGRDYKVGATRLTPFGAMSYAVLHGAGFAEQGSTGFELIAQPSTYQRLNAVAGLRLGTDWRSSSRWTSLNLTAGVRQSLLARNDARAAFAGAPDVSFALDGMPSQRNTGWLQMSLATGGAHWNWLLNYDRQASDQAVSLGANFKF